MLFWGEGSNFFYNLNNYNMTYRERIQYIDNCVYENMRKHSQIVIDTLEYLSEDIDEIDNVTGDVIDPTSDTLGSWLYKIGNLLEVYNNDFKLDIEILIELMSVLRDWQDERRKVTN